MGLSAYEMHEIFEQTVIIRKPTYGIVSGYHELPYICLGQSLEESSKTTIVRGRVHVSPRFVLRPQHLEPDYAEIFGDDNVDREIAGRMFGYFGFRGKPVECKSEKLELSHEQASVDRLLSDELDELDRREDITTGVMITPNPRYFPVSIERFIASVLEDEFRTK